MKRGTTCRKCGVYHIQPEQGRVSPICPSCYPLYRRAICLFCAARQRSKKKNLPFDLTEDWIFDKLKNGRCEITDLPFEFKSGGKNYGDRHPLTASIDRIVPELGYIKNNCRIVIWWFNAAKQRFNDVELWHLCHRVANCCTVNPALNAGVLVKTKLAII